MPVTVHVQLYRTGARASQPTMKYPKEDPEVMARLRRPFLEWLVNFGLPPSIGMAQLVLSGVFERFPKLKVFFAETRLGWVPVWLEHMDLWYKRDIGWAEEMLGFKPLRELPATYVRENIDFTVRYERVAVGMRHQPCAAVRQQFFRFFWPYEIVLAIIQHRNQHIEMAQRGLHRLLPDQLY